MRSPLQVLRDLRERRRLDEALSAYSSNEAKDPRYYRSGVDFQTNRPKYRMYEEYSRLFHDFCNEVDRRQKKSGIPELNWGCFGADSYDPCAAARATIVTELVRENPQYSLIARDLGFEVEKSG